MLKKQKKGMLKKIIQKSRLFFYGLIYGLKNADNKILSQIGNKKYDDTEINSKFEKGGVFADFLAENQTQQVKEMRDSYYRILRESDKYIVNYNDDGTLSTKKKDSNFYEKHVLVDNDDNLKIKLIQFNNIIVDSVSESLISMDYSNNESDCKYIFTLTYNDTIPRFNLTKYIKKIVLKETGANNYIMDVYCSIYPRQFNKVDELFTKELKKIMEKKDYDSDILNFNEIEFITNKAYHIDDLHLFKLKKEKIKNISVFDGNFIIKYEVTPEINGIDLTEKYRMVEMDEKYNINAPKSNIIDFNVATKISKGVI